MSEISLQLSSIWKQEFVATLILWGSWMWNRSVVFWCFCLDRVTYWLQKPRNPGNNNHLLFLRHWHMLTWFILNCFKHAEKPFLLFPFLVFFLCNYICRDMNNQNTSCSRETSYSEYNQRPDKDYSQDANVYENVPLVPMQCNCMMNFTHTYVHFTIKDKVWNKERSSVKVRAREDKKTERERESDRERGIIGSRWPVTVRCLWLVLFSRSLWRLGWWTDSSSLLTRG